MPEEMPSLPVPAPIWIKPERSKRRGSWSKTLSGLLIEEATIEDYQNFINRGFTSHDFLRTFSRLYSGEAERERVPAKVEAETLKRIALDFYTRGFDRLPKYTEILRFTGFFT